MPRPKNLENCAKLTIYLPESVLAKLSLLTFDPLREKTSRKSGFNKSKLIETLLREHFNKMGETK